jgi:hypothetical protein
MRLLIKNKIGKKEKSQTRVFNACEIGARMVTLF